MFPLFTLVSLTILGFNSVAGVLTNTFIVAVNFMDRGQGQTLNPSDLILFTMAVFNICFQGTMSTNDFFIFFWEKVYFSDWVYPIFTVLLLFTIFCSFWLTVCLCGFYCLQIILFSHPFLVCLKRGISKLVPWLLFWSMLLSLALSVPAIFNISKEPHQNSTVDLMSNTTLEEAVPSVSLTYLLISSIFGSCLPLLLVGASASLIITSLCKHATRMEQSVSGFSGPHKKASMEAAKTITSLLFLYISFYVSQILLILNTFPTTSSWFCVCLIIIYCYSPMQSLILITGSPKLKRLFHCPCCGGKALHTKKLVTVN
ncbi:taste receptor type 2 member 40-like [Rhinatrema bivittatum]|uniref:taste receptor type 2 member 40-like n=1 Tax=Rhinatrema bivittatum TaxID=194408 RepID=UPI0011263B5B|nr:taste receptor type 2 member 40-like [Rhinatrema bivittatum]